MSSPTSRTLELLRKEGWTAQVVERWNPHSKTRLDLFGWIDVLACRPKETPIFGESAFHCSHGTHLFLAGGCSEHSPADLPGRSTAPPPDMGGIVGIQACAGASHSSRKAKLLSEKRMAIWLAAGGRLELWSWSKRGARGKRKTWTARREPLSLSDFIASEQPAAGAPDVPRGAIP